MFRLAALATAAWLIHLAYGASMPDEPARLSLTQAKLIFPTAAQVGGHDRARNAYAVTNAAGEGLGFVLTTSPETDELIGYSGPSNLLVGLGPDGRVVGVRLLSSGDTPSHVDEVRRQPGFLAGFRGWHPAEPPPKVDAVAGSTLTSLAMAEAVERRLSGRQLSLRFPEAVTLSEVQGCFAAARSLAFDDPRAGWVRVRDAGGATLGFVLRTSPESDNVLGYAGPTESLAAVAADERTIVALRLRKSYDTQDYVERVRADDDYLALPRGKTVDGWAAIDFRKAGVEGVSGATQTSFAVAEGLRRRAAADVAARQAPAPAAPRVTWRWRDLGLLLVVAGSLAMSFTGLRGRPRVRIAWQMLLVLGFGLWFGDLLSLALLAGWARHGVPWRSSPALTLLVVVALATPWGTRQQIYCHQMCPHGAVQEWLGRLRRFHVAVPRGLSRWLGRGPYGLLAATLALAIGWVSFDLSQLEPFDAWILKQAAVVSSVIAVVGLLASLFVPQAYCRFGCPTGALLKLIRSHGAGDRWGWGDAIIAGALAAGAALLAGPALAARPSASEPALVELSGEAFGTTWSAKFRQAPEDLVGLYDALASELERLEGRLSHWRKTSETSQFNHSSTTLALEFSQDLVGLADLAQRLSRATDGAFDITVAPVVDLWGYGPSGPRPLPDDAQIAAALARVGYDKLVVDVADRTLKKKRPELSIDLGALLQGRAADRLAELLAARKAGDVLINVGGELRAVGAWNVAVENPARPGEPIARLTLRDASLAVSGVYRRPTGGAASDPPETRHILSPKTGRPIDAHWKLVAVIRPLAAEADGWATALLAASERSQDTANRESVAAMWIDGAGVRTENAAWRAATANAPASP